MVKFSRVLPRIFAYLPACNYKLIIALTMCLIAGANASTQVIFSEPFDEASGSISGTDNTGGVAWATTCPACLAGDHYEIQSGQLEGQDTNGPATWETGPIDISTCPYIQISFNISSQGVMEGCGTGCNSVDWVQLQYNIDGTGWQTPANSSFCAGPCADLNVVQSDDVVGGTTLYATGCMNGGNSIQLRIVVQAWASDEFWRIDNVSLSCTSGPSANAGSDITICEGSSVTLNGSGSGSPTWLPSGTLSNAAILNPIATPLVSTTYTLTMTSGVCTATDEVIVTLLNVSPLVVSPNATICSGDCISLTASGGDFFVWDPNIDILDSALATQNVCPSSTTTYTVSSFTVGSNLIINGDFSSGNSGFSSSYAFTNPTNTTEAQYNVIPNPQTFNGGFSSCTDHTTGTGNMMVVNGSSISGASVWCQTIAVTPNTNYLFSAWLASVFPTNPAQLQFTINGLPVGANLNATSTTCQWDEFFSTWNSGVNTSATICITNLNTSIAGNDFALDDISFSTVCEQTSSVTITVASSPVINSESDLIFCEDATVPLNSFVSVPAGATFSWTNSNPAIGIGASGTGNLPSFTATNSTASPLVGTITVSPSIGTCIGPDEIFTLTVNPNPTVGAGVDQSVCEGTAVTLTATNPDAATLSWNNGVVNGLAFTPGVGSVNYTVTATNATTGCFSTDIVNITITALPTVTVNPAGPFSSTAGVQTITASPAGGVWSADCGACINSSTGVFNPATAGVGTWEICYAVGTAPCIVNDCIFIEVSNTCLMTGTITSNNPTCFGLNDGSVTINVSNASGAPTFQISNSSGTVINLGNSNTANNLNAGWYYFNVTDDLNCLVIDSVLLVSPNQIAIDLVVQNPTCYNVPNGFAFVDTVYNYTGSYSQIGYFWNPNLTGLNGTGEDSLQNIGQGSYTILINDENGCSKLFDFDIVYPDSLYFVELGYEPAYCRLYSYQSGHGVVFAAASGGTPDYTYLWTNLTTGGTSVNSTWGGLNPGSYSIQVTDAKGCLLTKTLTVDSLNPIANFTLLSPEFTAAYEGNAIVNVHFENQSQHFANPNNPNADTTFFWNFGLPNGQWILSEDINETFDISYAQSGDYNVCLVAINKNGCTDTACTLITVYDAFSFTPINVFTPNGDNINDGFTFNDKASSVESFSCLIVDRWGIVIYEMTAISDVWNGNDNKGNPCSAGVYFYTYDYESYNGITGKGQGTIQLVR